VAAHRPEVADVLREHAAAYTAGHGTSVDQRRVLADLVRCRTAALGGHVSRCDHCGHEEIAYNSCRNRHCPKCQGPAQARWLAAREAELLDAPYFHVVFTLPQEIGPLALQNPRLVYGLLFAAASQTLVTIAADPKHLGARIGFLCVLHTWGQNLLHHPHLHCLVPGGGLSPDQQRWVPARRRFLLPVAVLRRFFRGRCLHLLERAFQEGQLQFHGQLADLAEPSAWQRWLSPLRAKPWVVYAKPPFGGPQQVLRYLARYTHRVAIANRRILSVADGQVSFLWKDYRRGQGEQVMTLTAEEFIRRFLLHVLPHGFQRLRHYGLLANRAKREKIALCRRLLAEANALTVEPDSKLAPSHPDRTDGLLCPRCGHGRMRVIARLAPAPSARPPPVRHQPWRQDRRAA
jgi:hypothetical protein